MSPSYPSLPEHFGRKMAGAIVLMLVLVLVAAFVAALILHKSPSEMALPYLVFAVPGPIFLLASMWLRALEDLGVRPKRLALAWTLMMMLFGLVIDGATVISGLKLRLLEQQDIFAFVGAGIFLTVITPFMFYRRMLTTIAVRAGKREQASPIK